MKVLFVLGFLLLIVAGFTVAAQSVVYALGKERMFLISAFDLWYALAPASLILTQIRLEKIAGWLWDPVVRTILAVPAWILAGGPGGALVWFFHPRRLMTPQQLEEHQQHADSVFLYDALAKEARESGAAAEGDDRLPDHGPDHLHRDAPPDAIEVRELIQGQPEGRREPQA